MSTNRNNSEIAEVLRGIRERLTRQFARSAPPPPKLNLPPFEPLKEAQAAVSHLAAAIGTVNPRPPGLANDLIQTFKQIIARLLEWRVRPQREFNRTVTDFLARAPEVMEATNRNLVVLAEAIDLSNRLHQELGQEVESLRAHFEERLASVDAHVEEQMKLQRWAYDGALARQSTAFQERTFALLGDLQGQFGLAIEKLQEELRLLRQRVAAQSKADGTRVAVHSPVPLSGRKTTFPTGVDYFQLERHFRGTEEEIRARQSFYLPFFQSRRNVLDIACGRGEFLQLMREAKVPARGVDLDADMVGCCLEKGLDAVQADAFAYLEAVPERSLDGIFCAQFLEHMEPEAYITLLSQCVEKLAPSGVLAVETPNPECLAMFSQTFFVDPSHVRPIPPAQLRFLFAEVGLGRITTHFLSPAAAGLPVVPKIESHVIEADILKAWNASVTQFNETFFGGMDYAVIGYRPDTAPRAASPARQVSAE